MAEVQTSQNLMMTSSIRGVMNLTQTLVQQPTVSVVIPALNEAENLPHVLPLIPPWVYEVLLVDGQSTDGTVEVARSLHPDIRIVQQERRGKGAALQSGFAAATGDIIVMLDADGSTDPREIPLFYAALCAGADFAKGSRFLQGGGTADMPLYRQLGNGAFVLISRLFFGGKYSDLCYGYNAFWRHILPILALDGDGFEIETMMNVRALRAGLKVMEVPSFEAERVYGEGRLRTIPDGLRVLRTLLRERFKGPIRVGNGGHASNPSQLLRESVHEAHYGSAVGTSDVMYEPDVTADVPEAESIEARN